MRTTWLAACCLLLVVGCAGNRQRPAVRVTDLGATPDGATDSTAAFQRALDRGGTVRVPAGRYLVGSLFLKAHTTLHLDPGATLVGSPDPQAYPLARVRWEGRWREGHRAMLNAINADHVTIEGPGAIEGPPFAVANLRNPRGPCLIETIGCDHVRLADFSTDYRRMWSIHLTTTDHVTCDGLHIRSEPKPSNGDGIDVDSCQHVAIRNCDIDTGDDAIALKSGRGTEGFTENRPTAHVTIDHCRLGSSFAGLAIGSEMSGSVRDVTFTHCTFPRGANAVFIKSRVGRGGAIEHIHGAHLDAAGPACFLRIDLTNRGIQDEVPVEGSAGIPVARDLTFEHVRSLCPTFCDAARVPDEKPIERLVIRDVQGTCRSPITVKHVRGLVVDDVKLSGFQGKLVTAEDVK